MALLQFQRPWSSSQDVTTPSLRCRSVTGWPHHLIPQICRVPASTGRSPKPLRPWGSTRAACAAITRQGMWLDKKGSCFASSPMRERYPPSPPFQRGLSRLADCKSAVAKRAGRRRVEHYHQLPPFTQSPRFRSRSRRGARLSTVLLAGASPAGTARPSFTSGTRKTATPLGLGPRDTRGGTGVPDQFHSL